MPRKRLLRCKTCRLSWFPEGGTTAACPACGGKNVGRALEPFHLGLVLIALALLGWMRPLIAEVLPGDGPATAASAVGPANRTTAEAERAPTRGPAATDRRRDNATVRKRKHRRSKDRRGHRVYVTSNELKRRQKAKTRSEHVQR